MVLIRIVCDTKFFGSLANLKPGISHFAGKVLGKARMLPSHDSESGNVFYPVYFYVLYPCAAYSMRCAKACTSGSMPNPTLLICLIPFLFK